MVTSSEVKKQEGFQDSLTNDSGEILVKQCLQHVAQAKELFDKVADSGVYNFQSAKVRVPSGLNTVKFAILACLNLAN